MQMLLNLHYYCYLTIPITHTENCTVFKLYTIFDIKYLGIISVRQQVFDVLWCLVCHDIWFVWERSEFLQQAEGQALTSKAFTVRSVTDCFRQQTSFQNLLLDV